MNGTKETLHFLVQEVKAQREANKLMQRQLAEVLKQSLPCGINEDKPTSPRTPTSPAMSKSSEVLPKSQPPSPAAAQSSVVAPTHCQVVETNALL